MAISKQTHYMYFSTADPMTPPPGLSDLRLRRYGPITTGRARGLQEAEIFSKCPPLKASPPPPKSGEAHLQRCCHFTPCLQATSRSRTFF